MSFARGMILGVLGGMILMYFKDEEMNDLINTGFKKSRKMFRKYKYMLG